jgi:hypothetical protein
VCLLFPDFGLSDHSAPMEQPGFKCASQCHIDIFLKHAPSIDVGVKAKNTARDSGWEPFEYAPTIYPRTKMSRHLVSPFSTALPL